MNNNQNYQQPNIGGQQPPQGYQPQYNNAQWQQPPKKKMSTGCIVGIIIGVLLFLGLIVAVVLISIGFFMYNSAIVTVDGPITGIDSQMISIFNARYQLYFGEDKSKSTVISLIQSTKVNNMYEDNKVDITIKLNDGSSYSLDEFNTSELKTYGKYDINAKDYSQAGYLTAIEIVEK